MRQRALTMDEWKEAQGDRGKQIPSAGRNPPVVRVKDVPLSSQLKYTRHTNTHTVWEGFPGGLGNAGALLSMLCFPHSFIKFTGQLYAQ